jgi:hypothetical protein
VAALLGALAVLVTVLQRANSALFGGEEETAAAVEEEEGRRPGPQRRPWCG